MNILLLRTDEKLTWAEISGYTGCLDSARRKSIEKKKNDGDKINSLLSRLLVISEIKRRTGFSDRKIKFTFGPFGKPYLKNSDLQFSLSHTKGAIVAAFEEERFRATSDSDFIRFWVQKEAFLKRLGVGLSRDLRGVNVPDLPDTTAIDCGDLFVGVSGKGALEASVTEITLEELLNRYTKLL